MRSMDIYHLTRDVYEGALAFTHGFSMKQNLIYIPERAVVAQNPQNENEFFYLTDRKILEDMKSIVDKKNIKAIEADANDISNLLNRGAKKENTSREFNDKAKSLFEIVMKGKKAGACCCS